MTDHPHRPPAEHRRAPGGEPDYVLMAKEALENMRAEERLGAALRLKEVWKLDLKTVSIILTVAIGLGGNAFAIGGWVSGVNSRQAADEQQFAALKVATEADAAGLKNRIDEIEKERSVGLQRLAAVEQVSKDISIQLVSISDKLDRLALEGRPQRAP